MEHHDSTGMMIRSAMGSIFVVFCSCGLSFADRKERDALVLYKEHLDSVKSKVEHVDEDQVQEIPIVDFERLGWGTSMRGTSVNYLGAAFDLIIRSLEDHGRSNPSHGVNCICMDRYSQAFNELVSMAGNSKVEDLRVRLRHIFGMVIRKF